MKKASSNKTVKPRRKYDDAYRRQALQSTQAIQPKSVVPRTTDSRRGQRMSPNLLAGLEVSRPPQAVVSDITYSPLHTGQWAYLATWLYLYSRKIVGWQAADTMTADLVISALRRARAREQLPRGLIAHSDRPHRSGQPTAGCIYW